MRITIYIISCLVSSVIGGVLVYVFLSYGVGEITVGKIYIEDRSGRQRIFIGTSPKGDPIISFMDKERSKMVIGDVNNSPSIFMAGETSAPALAITTKDNEPQLFMYSKKSKTNPVIAIAISESVAGIVIYDENQKSIWSTVKDKLVSE